MNGLFGTFGSGVGGYAMPQSQTPRQNVQQYVNAPIMSIPAQRQPQITMANFLRATQPKQENFFNTTDANPLLHVAGYPLNQPQQQPPSQTELMLQKISGYNGNTTN